MPILPHAKLAEIFATYVAANRTSDMQPIYYIIRNYRNGMPATDVCVQLILYMGCIAYRKNKESALADVLVPQLCAAIDCDTVFPPCLWLYTIMATDELQHIDVLYDICTLIEHLMRRIAHYIRNTTVCNATGVINTIHHICAILGRCTLHAHTDMVCFAIHDILHNVQTHVLRLAPL